jgi:hypothetical protein
MLYLEQAFSKFALFSLFHTVHNILADSSSMLFSKFQVDLRNVFDDFNSELLSIPDFATRISFSFEVS